MANPFIHIELQTKDVDISKKFHSEMFSWRLEDIPGMDYTMINVGDGTGGGIMKNPLPGTSDNWLPYILVEDAVASTKKVLALGAAISKDVTEVPGVGRFSVISDPTGAAFGLWQPKTEM